MIPTPANFPYLRFNPRAFHVAIAARGLPSVSALAPRIGLSPRYARIVAGGYVPSPVIRRRIAIVLAVKEGELWEAI